MGTRMSRRLVLAGTLAVLAAGCGSSKSSPPAPPPPVWKAGDPVTLAVGAWFPAGTQVRDAYTGSTATVDASGSVTVTPGPSGATLLEKVGAAASPFTWKDATVYFVITDRFSNGDTANDNGYGTRPKDGASEIGTWHGGDFAGLTAKLDYIQGLGATAIWISPFVEQIHGWVAGGSGDFKHYGYHGYYALDFTRIDQNLGDATALHALVDGAHQRGIRVLADVVVNHPGYATGDDLRTYLPEVFFDGTGDAYAAWAANPGPAPVNWNGMYQWIDYTSDGWKNWWANTAFLDLSSPPSTYYTWIRAGSKSNEFPGFRKPGTGELTKSVGFLPDFITEGTAEAGLPTLLSRKAGLGGTGATYIPGATVRDYLVKWQSDWVREYGFDGFRCDTAANVDLPTWAALKTASAASFEFWKTSNPGKPVDAAAPFWMVGEVFGHGVQKDAYYTSGFDALLNFSFQGWLRDLFWTQHGLAAGFADLETLYAGYAAAMSNDSGFNALSYLSSHDTRLFYGDILGYDAALQRQAGTAFLLLPGAVQIFYGDESGRRLGPAGSDPAQGTRSDMNFATTDAAILAHWQKLGAFRKAHAAVGAGNHTRITSIAGTYAFARSGGGAGSDAVVVILTAPN